MKTFFGFSYFVSFSLISLLLMGRGCVSPAFMLLIMFLVLKICIFYHTSFQTFFCVDVLFSLSSLSNLKQNNKIICFSSENKIVFCTYRASRYGSNPSFLFERKQQKKRNLFHHSLFLSLNLIFLFFFSSLIAKIVQHSQIVLKEP